MLGIVDSIIPVSWEIEAERPHTQGQPGHCNEHLFQNKNLKKNCGSNSVSSPCLKYTKAWDQSLLPLKILNELLIYVLSY